MAKPSDPTPVTVRQCRMLSGRCFTTPSPQTSVHSTSIAPVASGTQHQYCPSGQWSTAPALPSGQRSWCKFNRALANSEPSPPHPPTIHPDIVRPLKKVFERLSHPTLMERCVLGVTQNLNESFNRRSGSIVRRQSSALQPRWRLLSI